MDMPQFISFMVMWMLLLFGVLAIILTYRHHRHVVDLNHKERMHALERGFEMPAPSAMDGSSVPGARGVPSASDASNARDARSSQYLHRGLIFALLGFSMMVAFGVNAGASSALWGLPVAAVGAAYLILHVFHTRKPRQK